VPHFFDSPYPNSKKPLEHTEVMAATNAGPFRADNPVLELMSSFTARSEQDESGKRCEKEC